MSSLQNIRNREFGLPHVQADELLRTRIASSVVNNCYRSGTIQLPSDRFYSFARNEDFVAVLSITNTDLKVRSVALWSLPAKCKLWEMELDYNYQETNPGSALLSSTGVVLVGDLSLRNLTKIVFNGKQTGTLPSLHYNSIHCIGMRILTSWKERHEPRDNSSRWLPENSSSFFGEWDHEGKVLKRYPLDLTRGRGSQACTCNEHYWVKLTESNNKDLAPIIEVVHRTKGEIKTFELPFSDDEESFSSPTIVLNLLFYGKNIVRKTGELLISEFFEPTLCIFDLAKGEVIGEFPTQGKRATIRELVASRNYAAWVENKQVKYLNIQSKVVYESMHLPIRDHQERITLGIVDTLLTITYLAYTDYSGWTYWHRKVIDLSDSELKCDAEYRTSPLVRCSFSNGIMLVPNDSEMYVESYSDGSLQMMSPLLTEQIEI